MFDCRNSNWTELNWTQLGDRESPTREIRNSHQDFFIPKHRFRAAISGSPTGTREGRILLEHSSRDENWIRKLFNHYLSAIICPLRERPHSGLGKICRHIGMRSASSKLCLGEPCSRCGQFDRPADWRLIAPYAATSLLPSQCLFCRMNGILRVERKIAPGALKPRRFTETTEPRRPEPRNLGTSPLRVEHCTHNEQWELTTCHSVKHLSEILTSTRRQKDHKACLRAIWQLFCERDDVVVVVVVVVFSFWLVFFSVCSCLVLPRCLDSRLVLARIKIVAWIGDAAVHDSRLVAHYYSWLSVAQSEQYQWT